MAGSAAAAMRRRPASSHTADISCGTVTARAAFSHVPFWQSLSGMVTRIVSRPTPGNVAAPPTKHGLVEQVRACNATSISQGGHPFSSTPHYSIIPWVKFDSQTSAF